MLMTFQKIKKNKWSSALNTWSSQLNFTFNEITQYTGDYIEVQQNL